MKLRYILAALAISALSTNSHAAFIETDWKVAGDKMATLDTRTGLEWLDLSISSNTIEFMQIHLDRGYDGYFGGWRFATIEEIHYLMQGLFPNVMNDKGLHTVVQEYYRPIPFDSTDVKKFGPSSTNGYFFYGTYAKGNSTYMAGMSYPDTTTPGVLYNYYVGTLSQTYSSSYQGAKAGIWLVSDGGTTLTSIADPSINQPVTAIGPSDVNAPTGLFASLVLLAAGLIRRKTIKST